MKSTQKVTMEGVHPMLQPMYQHLVQEQKDLAEGLGKLWQMEKVLQLREATCL